MSSKMFKKGVLKLKIVIFKKKMIRLEHCRLRLTEDSKKELKYWLSNSKYQPLLEGAKEYLDHCTLFHPSCKDERLRLLCETACALGGGSPHKATINGIGISDKALAFRVKNLEKYCCNKIPHITICTFGEGKPVDSNFITNWEDIDPITIMISIEGK